MTRTWEVRCLFGSIAVALVIFLERQWLAERAQRILGIFDPSYMAGNGWGLVGYNFFDDHWALTLAVLIVVFFGYRVATAHDPKDPPA